MFLPKALYFPVALWDFCNVNCNTKNLLILLFLCHVFWYSIIVSCSVWEWGDRKVIHKVGKEKKGNLAVSKALSSALGEKYFVDILLRDCMHALEPINASSLDSWLFFPALNWRVLQGLFQDLTSFRSFWFLFLLHLTLCFHSAFILCFRSAVLLFPDNLIMNFHLKSTI